MLRRALILAVLLFALVAAPAEAQSLPRLSNARYVTAASAYLEDVTPLLLDMADVIGRANDDPSLFTDPAWLRDVEVMSADLRIALVIPYTIYPPRGFTESHFYLVASSAYLLASLDQLDAAIDNLEPDAMRTVVYLSIMAQQAMTTFAQSTE